MLATVDAMLAPTAANNKGAGLREELIVKLIVLEEFNVINWIRLGFGLWRNEDGHFLCF